MDILKCRKNAIINTTVTQSHAFSNHVNPVLYAIFTIYDALNYCQSCPGIEKTSRERPKSAPYPRLKNSKMTFKCQFTVLENRKAKKMDRVAPWPASASPWRAKEKKIEKKSRSAEKN